jgi:hypothetical protein
MTKRHVRWIAAIILVLCLVVVTQFVRPAPLHGTNTTTNTDSTVNTVTIPDGLHYISGWTLSRRGPV